MDTVSTTIQGGYHTTIKVQAMEVVPSEDLHYIPFDKRGSGCRFKDETEGLELFSSYSQSACEFEYKLKMAEELCRCTPWYHPSKMNKLSYNLCDLHGNYCFKAAMNKIEDVPEKICLPTCHQLQFTSTTELIKSNADEICKDDQRNKEIHHIALSQFGNGYSKLYYEYRKLLENDTYKLDPHFLTETAIQDICKSLVDQDIARVSVMFESKRYVRTTTNIRVTFLDMVSSFGKIYCVVLTYYYILHNSLNNQLLFTL